MLRELTKKLREKGDLAYQEVGIAVESLIDEKIPPEIKADFLIALNQKGETVNEIEAFAKKLKSYSI
ncbi:MAG TPA: anthranilate phosphoribosyltransferase, partial [Verrucomicrobiota bacterium]|nr:anthranilate phosphoribosyltransferase [Verrucomicrobiota bacterium]